MAKLQAFSDLCKSQEDLLAKGYVYNYLTALSILNKSDDLDWKIKGRQSVRRESKNLSSVLLCGNLERKNSNWTTNLAKKTDGQLKIGLTHIPKDLSDSLKLKGEIIANPSSKESKATVSAAWTQPKYVFKASLNEGPTLKANLTVGRPEIGIGAEGAFNFTTTRLTTYDLAFWWHNAGYNLVFKHVSNNKYAYAPGDFLISYYGKWSDNTSIGGTISTSYVDRKTTVAFGAEHNPTSDATFKTKFDSTGNLGLSITRVLNPFLTITGSALFDVRKITNFEIKDYKFGIRFDFTN